jgi:hypothetical protein
VAYIFTERKGINIPWNDTEKLVGMEQTAVYGNAAKGSQSIGSLLSAVLLFHCTPFCDLELWRLVRVYPPLNLCPLLEIGRFLTHQKFPFHNQ